MLRRDLITQVVAASLAVVVLSSCQLIAGIEERKFRKSDASADAGDNDAAENPDTGKPKSDAAMDAGDKGKPDAGADSGADAAVSEECMSYCDTVMSACTGKYATYPDMDQCLKVCEVTAVGDITASDPTDNSVACRLNQADLAMSTLEDFQYCAAAGPGGADICGTNCESYCALFASFCPDKAVDNCEQRCAGLRDLDDESKMSFDDSNYDLTAHQVGELLQCRIVHVSAAAVDPDNECWKATIKPRPNGNENPPCTYPKGVDPRCEDYCKLNLVACTGANTVYESEEQCLSVCNGSTAGAGMDPGTGLDFSGENTIGCRIAHSFNAFDGATTHCPHSGPGGEGVCGDNCESYCRIVQDICPTEFVAAFGTNVASCVTRCGSYNKMPKYTVSAAEGSGDTFACRLLHATRAYADATECAAAFGAAPCAP